MYRHAPSNSSAGRSPELLAWLRSLLHWFSARFASKTLLAEQIEGQGVAQACDKAMEFLLDHNFIVATAAENRQDGKKREGGSEEYGVAPTQLGQARLSVF